MKEVETQIYVLGFKGILIFIGILIDWNARD